MTEAIEDNWVRKGPGWPSKGFYSYRGTDFCNSLMKEYSKKLGLSQRTTPHFRHGPTNRLCERNHATVDGNQIKTRKLWDLHTRSGGPGLLLEKPCQESWTATWRLTARHQNKEDVSNKKILQLQLSGWRGDLCLRHKQGGVGRTRESTTPRRK